MRRGEGKKEKEATLWICSDDEGGQGEGMVRARTMHIWPAGKKKGEREASGREGVQRMARVLQASLRARAGLWNFFCPVRPKITSFWGSIFFAIKKRKLMFLTVGLLGN